MKRVLLYIIGLLIIIIENSILNYINIFDTSFNLLIIYISIVSLYLDEIEIGIIAILLGFTKDISIGSVFGINALILFFISYPISFIREKIYKQSNATIFTLVLLTSIFDSIVSFITYSLIYNNYGLLNHIFKGIFLIPLDNAILSVIIFNLFKNYISKLQND